MQISLRSLQHCSTWWNTSWSCKTQWNSISNSSTSNTCSHIFSAGTILELRNTMDFRQQHIHQKRLKPLVTMERRFETVPSMTRDRPAPVVPQSLIVEVRRHTLYGKTAFGASAISEKRISCEASSKSVCSRCAKRRNSARHPQKNATCYSSLHSSTTRCSSLH